jgi:hypothetical protein
MAHEIKIAKIAILDHHDPLIDMVVAYVPSVLLLIA